MLLELWLGRHHQLSELGVAISDSLYLHVFSGRHMAQLFVFDVGLLFSHI